ncbi:MAG: hypothetical protein ACPGXZ_00200 [Saprospiraceae bacterium]
MNTETKFYILDSGENMHVYAKMIIKKLQEDGIHFLHFETDSENLFCCEEVDEDEFLNLFRLSNDKSKNNGYKNESE